MLQKGDIVIIKFPFADAAEYKKRPALIISNHEVNKTGDYLMVQITSKDKKDDLSLPIKTNNYTDDKELPLKSYIRLHKIFLLNESLVIAKATSVKPDFLENITGKIIELIR
ncbi:MAG: type II toxin-antitoxin system PemK/MazF family toxin [Bacteroidales bacterium]|nr:type II toxin-antitoxin system PemK/MazF family toxin [Bacteroidales bacterium]